VAFWRILVGVVGYWASSRSRHKKKLKKRQQTSKQTCKNGTKKEEKWKICEGQICCPRNRKIDIQADRQSTDLQMLGHPNRPGYT
jgi:hypothetical protein